MKGCRDCEQTTANDCGKPGHGLSSSIVYGTPTPPTGWLCPRCGRSNAPFIAQCPPPCEDTTR